MDITFLIVGLLFAFVGGFLLWREIYARLHYRSAEGEVVALEKRTTPPSGTRKQGGPMYYPVIEYIARGNKKTFTGNMGSSWPAHRIGQRVPVLYSPQKEDPRLKSLMPLLLGLIFFGVGATLCVVFITTFRFSAFSIAGSSVFGLLFVYQIRKALKKRDISSLDEFKEALRNTDMKTAAGIAPEESIRITRTEDLSADRREQSRALKYLGPLFTVIGLGVVVLGIWLGLERARFLEKARAADGEVVELISKRSDDSYVYYPVVEFQVPGSFEVQTFQHDTGSNPPSYSVGEQVRVLFDPSDPATAIIDAGIFNWFGSGLALLLGFVFTAAGIASVTRWLKYRD